MDIHTAVNTELLNTADNPELVKQRIQDLGHDLTWLMRDLVLTRSKMCRGCKIKRDECRIKKALLGVLLSDDFNITAAVNEIQQHGVQKIST